MIKEFKNNKKLLIGFVGLVLLVFVIYASIPFMSGIFGAAIVAYIFYPLTKALRSKGFSARSCAWIILVISLLMVILPLVLIINGLIEQTQLLPAQLEKLDGLNEKINATIPFAGSLDYEEILAEIRPILTSSIAPLFSNIFNVFFILFLLFFLLYYIVLYSQEISSIFHRYLPFGERINTKIINEFHQVTNATIVGTFLIALIQGGMLAINFYLLGIPNALFWGFITPKMPLPSIASYQKFLTRR